MANISPDAAPPLDAPRAGGDVHCPLCEYNLRGLAEPRCGGLVLLVTAYRLASVFHHYLRFDHPIATVAAAHVVAGLLLAVALVRWWLL